MTYHRLDRITNMVVSPRSAVPISEVEGFENGIHHLRKVNSRLADAYKELLVLICKIIIESDGIIAEAETAEVKKLLELCD